MKISYNWLKQFIKTDQTADQTAELLTDLGLEIEGISTYESIKGSLQGVVVGEIQHCEKHTNADQLKLTQVNVGSEQPLQIVCGAPNVAVGQKVAVACVGTTLYSKEGVSWVIKKGKIRGEESHGMICAEDELGLGESHEGIMTLDSNLVPGTPLSEVFPVETDTVFEIGLTPNRADAMSHFGVARDLRAGRIQQGTILELITPSVSAFHTETRLLKVDIAVEDKILAPRYCGVTISGIDVKPSPQWLQNRLKAIDLKPINNVVDATNYVLHELGQPLHAFDVEKIANNKIEVKTVPSGTLFTTLDGVERTLHEDDLMICDAQKPLCIAGVFGGIDSGVSEHTTSIFLESAFFNPISIRKTAKRHGLNTDASFRFERGIDPNITKYALKRAALLIQELAGGEVASDIMDIYPSRVEDYEIRLSFDSVKRLIGERIPKETIKSILTSLEIKINNVTESGLGLTVPPYRNDVQREVDVIEEILRVYGYNTVETSKKVNASIAKTSRFEDYKIQNITGDQLVAQGFFEIISNSLTTPSYAALSEQLDSIQSVAIVNPLSSDLSVLRQSLLFSGLEALAYNINRKQQDLKLFEFGKVYRQANNKTEEFKRLSLLMTGNQTPEHWHRKAEKTDFFFLKGVVTTVLDRLGISKYSELPVQNDLFGEGLSVCAGKISLVDYGLVKTSILKSFGITQDVVYADFNWEAILELIKQQKISFKPIAKYPQVRRDFALLLDADVTFEAIYKIAKQTEKYVLKAVTLFDVYQGKNLPKGKKSYAVSFVLQDDKKTLTDKQIERIMNKLKTQFERQLGAELR